jgi:hypothetical protein
MSQTGHSLPRRLRRQPTHVRNGSKADEAIADAQATIDVFNSRLAAGKMAWFWPTIGAALATKNTWLIIACDSCDTIIDLDLTVKRRDPDASIRVALKNVQCPRCNGAGRPRIIALQRFPSV